MAEPEVVFFWRLESVQLADALARTKEYSVCGRRLGAYQRFDMIEVKLIVGVIGLTFTFPIALGLKRRAVAEAGQVTWWRRYDVKKLLSQSQRVTQLFTQPQQWESPK